MVGSISPNFLGSRGRINKSSSSFHFLLPEDPSANDKRVVLPFVCPPQVVILV